VQNVEKIVTVPEIKYVDVVHEVDQVVEEVRYVNKRVEQQRYIDVPRHVPKVVVVPKEKIVQVAKTVQVPKPYVVDVPVPYTTFKDTPWPVVVAQKLIPVLVNECVDEAEVEVKNYVPYIVPIDVYVPRAVQLPYIMGQSQIQAHVVTGVPVSHWNGLVHRLNPQMIQDAILQPYAPLLRETDGSSPVAQNPPLVQPIVSIHEIQGYPNFLEYLRRLAIQGPIYGLSHPSYPVQPSVQQDTHNPNYPNYPNYTSYPNYSMNYSTTTYTNYPTPPTYPTSQNYPTPTLRA